MGSGFAWHRVRDEELLDLRLCDLPVRIEGTLLQRRVERLYHELESRAFRFKPHVWLSHEWFAPDGVPGFAIPFYLAHPRLMKLERQQMLEVEGGSERECMRILRHEAGHALDTAFRLHFKQNWRKVFGSYSQPYPDSYKPKPDSRNYVLHLNAWYAQAHPAEDFAETFAVWLNSGSRWRRRYQNWPALRKLEYVDRLMEEVAGMKPINNLRIKVEPLSDLKQTLRQHYRNKRRYYAVEWLTFYDQDLRRIFSQETQKARFPTASSFLRRIRNELRHAVAQGTGAHHYTVDHVLKNMIARCKDLKLRVTVPESRAKEQALIMLTVQTMNVVHSGYHRVAV